jgi:hypothetical protein
VEGDWKAQGGHRLRKPRLLRQERSGLQDGEAPYLLVSHSPLKQERVRCTDHYYRDAFTTSSDFIISPHAAAKGLYIATGGNFHGFKFFPVLGKYIVDMLEGGLSPELMNKWAWDRERPDPCLFADYPRHEMNDFDDPVRTSRL